MAGGGFASHISLYRAGLLIPVEGKWPIKNALYDYIKKFYIVCGITRDYGVEVI